jgi:Fanconi anemia group M protein
MVFTNYRDTASSLLKFLKSEPSIRAVRFVGQSSRDNDEGLSQRKQAEILQKFRAGDYNVLIATSVGEEGIDIPATDLVIFYEPVPSEIRSIQRKGRTGRARAGRVVVLMAKGTRDEAYYWISDRKEKTMNRQIRGLSSPGGDLPQKEPPSRQLQITEASAGPAGIDDTNRNNEYIEHGNENNGPKEEEHRRAIGKVVVDFREREMAKLLESSGIEVVVQNLEVADYVISDKVAVERKNAQDFVSSIIDPQRNLFRQIADLVRTYERPVLILEGRDLYTTQMNAASIRGAMISVAVDYGLAIIPTEDQEETAEVIAQMAQRENREGREPKVHGHKTARTLKEQQEYLVSAISSVGPAVARNLLKHFGSVEKIMTASSEQLQEVELVGPKIAQRIRELVGGEYKG